MLSQQDATLLWQVLSTAFGCPEKDDGGTGSVTRASGALQVVLLRQRVSRALPCCTARALPTGQCSRAQPLARGQLALHLKSRFLKVKLLVGREELLHSGTQTEVSSGFFNALPPWVSCTPPADTCRKADGWQLPSKGLPIFASQN